MKRLPHIAVVLVEPQHPGNIGMICRAMANFGLTDLRLVNPCQHLHPEAAKFAVFAKDLLGQARLYPDLAEALADLHLTVATTRRQGRLRGELLDSTELPTLVSTLPSEARVGLVFGREDAGLTSEEVALCSHAATIASATETGSLNLAQAVLAFLYELNRTAMPGAARTDLELPEHSEVEAVFTQMQQVLDRIAFLNPSRPQSTMYTLRQLLQRSRPSRQDIALLRGLWSQLEESVRDWPNKRRGGG